MPFRYATVAETDTSYLDVLDAPILAGRGFNAADAEPAARVAIVDQGFVDQRSAWTEIPLGSRCASSVRGNPDGPSEWYSVVGLVGTLDLGVPYRKGPFAGFYLPGTPDRFGGDLNMMIRVRGGDPMTVAPQVREIAAAVDPSLRLVQVQRLNELNDGMLWVIRLWMSITAVMSSVALLLSLAGLYAVMAFTVARRTREIGVRVALGGSRQRISRPSSAGRSSRWGLACWPASDHCRRRRSLYPVQRWSGRRRSRGLTLAAIAMQARLCRA